MAAMAAIAATAKIAELRVLFELAEESELFAKRQKFSPLGSVVPSLFPLVLESLVLDARFVSPGEGELLGVVTAIVPVG